MASGINLKSATNNTCSLTYNGTSDISVDVSNIAAGNKMAFGTAVATTSGTYVDFTGIPSWAKRITVMFSGVSTSGTSNPLFQLGTLGGISASGYAASGSNIGSSVVTTNYTTGIGLNYTSASALYKGSLVFTNISSNTWVASGVATNGASNTFTMAGDITLSGTLDRIRITTVNGTDTFDAGTINIMWEGI